MKTKKKLKQGSSHNITTRSKSKNKNLNHNLVEIEELLKVSDDDPVILKHYKNTGHNFKWDEFRILDHEPHFLKRNVSEMLHINIQEQPINKNEDSQGLFKPYLYCLHKMKD